MGTLLRYPYEVRDEKDYFEDIPSIKIEKEMLDLAKHIVQTKSGHFDPEKFEDHYENAVKELLANKQAGEKIACPGLEPESFSRVWPAPDCFRSRWRSYASEAASRRLQAGVGVISVEARTLKIVVGRGGVA